ncbi:metallophosphoesterase family protein [Pararhizobium mangrovi]|nr:metallophosphoesterase [Pararhizobium mangrovi]
MQGAITLAHISDPHLSCALPKLGECLGKRFLTLQSWRRRRETLHDPAVAETIRRDCQAAAPDGFAVTGDLVNFAMEREFAASATWLCRLAAPERVALVPGNHDALVRGAAKTLRHHWRPWLGEGNEIFPYVRRIGPVDLVCVSSAVATAPLLASGRVGRTQLDRLRSLLATPLEERCRVVLIHHPPVDGLSPARKALTDRHAVARVIAEGGVHMVLHGHLHADLVSTIDADGGPVPVLGVPSMSIATGHHEHAGSWRRIRLSRGGAAGWRAVTALRSVTSEGGIEEAAPVVFDLPKLPV